MILNLLELIFKILEWGIRMPKRAFGYVGNEIWAAEAESIRIPKNGIRMLEIEFGCPRGHSDTLNKLLKRRVFEGEEQQRNLKQNDYKLHVMLGNQPEKH